MVVAAGSHTECAAGPRQPSALRSASLLVHRILLGTAQGQTQLGTLQGLRRECGLVARLLVQVSVVSIIVHSE